MRGNMAIFLNSACFLCHSKEQRSKERLILTCSGADHWELAQNFTPEFSHFKLHLNADESKEVHRIHVLLHFCCSKKSIDPARFSILHL